MDKNKSNLSMQAASLAMLLGLLALSILSISYCSKNSSSLCHWIYSLDSNVLIFILVTWNILIALSAGFFWLSLFAPAPFSVIFKPAAKLAFFITLTGIGLQFFVFYSNSAALDFPPILVIPALIPAAYILTGRPSFRIVDQTLTQFQRVILSLTVAAAAMWLPFFLAMQIISQK